MTIFIPSSRSDWRNWLLKNSLTEKGVYLVYFKKHTSIPSLSWKEAVEEALCFGWIDSTKKRIDDKSYRQLFTPRKATSTWSRINKELVQKLEIQNLMTDLGREAIYRAKENGSWDFLEECYKFNIPKDLVTTLSTQELNIFNSLNKSLKFQMLVELKMKTSKLSRQKIIMKIKSSLY